MKKVFLVLFILFVSGCSDNTKKQIEPEILKLEIVNNEIINLFDYSETSCDFMDTDKEVSISGSSNDEAPIKILLEKQELNDDSYNHILTINDNQVDIFSEVFRVKRIFLIDDVIMVEGMSCFEEGCTFINGYDKDGTEVYHFEGFYPNKYIGGRELFEEFLSHEIGDLDYEIDEDNLYVYITRLINIDGTLMYDGLVDICNNPVDEEPVSSLGAPQVGYYYKIHYNGDLTFSVPELVSSLPIHNAIDLYCNN